MTVAAVFRCSFCPPVVDELPIYVARFPRRPFSELWPEIAKLDFPVYCAGGSAPASVHYHHAADLDCPIGCGDVAVFPGDVLVGDAEGVVVIPAHLADEVAAAAVEQERLERFLLREIQQGRGVFGTYPPNDETLARYEAWKAAGEPGN